MNSSQRHEISKKAGDDQTIYAANSFKMDAQGSRIITFMDI
jgi:hypothetical protein